MKRRLTGQILTSGGALPLHEQREVKQKDKRSLSAWALAIRFVFSLLMFIYFVHWTTNVSQHQHDPPSYIPKAKEQAVWEWPVIHIVNTRFMQEQGNLTALAKARLALFQVFCLPTMQNQSSQQFLWIIKTDPNLDQDVLAALVGALRPYPNFFLVASNNNFRVNEDFPGAWRDGAEVEDLSQSRIYTGDQTLLENAMTLHRPTDPYPVIETRLDSDDGLHLEYLKAIQDAAMEILKLPDKRESSRANWMYWCSRRHVEWHFAEKSQGSEAIWKQITTFGAFQGIQHSNLCITPGITVGFGYGISEKDVPVFGHQVLMDKIRETPHDQACGLLDHNDCLQFVEGFVFEAIRSRSPTSAGMLKIEVNAHEVATDAWLYFAYVNMVRDKFGIQLQRLKWMNEYLSDNLLSIAEENLMGQCTTGHSCKVSRWLELPIILDRFLTNVFGLSCAG